MLKVCRRGCLEKFEVCNCAKHRNQNKLNCENRIGKRNEHELLKNSKSKSLKTLSEIILYINTQSNFMPQPWMHQCKSKLGNIRILNKISKINDRQKNLKAHIQNSMKFRGFCVLDNFSGIEIAKEILSEFENLRLNNQFQNGGILSSNYSTRSDKILWVGPGQDGCQNINKFIQFTDEVMVGGNDVIDNRKIVSATKAMLSVFPGNGSDYQMHVDNPLQDGRYVTCTYYLNVGWKAECDGGVLKLAARKCGKVARIEPIIDRMVFYYSDHRNPNQIEPCFRDRMSITMWYIDRDERMKALQASK